MISAKNGSLSIIEQLELMHIGRLDITTCLSSSNHFVISIDNDCFTNAVAVLLIDLGETEVRVALVLAWSEVVGICGSSDSIAVPNEVAELVIDVRSWLDRLVW